MIIGSCNICNLHILSHSYFLNCSICKGFTHIKCLSLVNKFDSLYVERNNNEWICVICSGNIFPFNHFLDDSDFINVVSDNCSSNQQISLPILENMIFNPFDLNDDSTINSLLNVDYEEQNLYPSYNNLCRSNYYLEDVFRKKYKDMNINSDVFSLFHLNIRSAPKNLDKLEQYLKNLDHDFSIIGLTETWFKDSNVLTYNLSGYKHEHIFRKVKSGGGVSLFIKENYRYKIRNDLSKLNEYIEVIFVELDRSWVNTAKNVVVGVIYRPPNTDMSLFANSLNELLSQLKSEKKNIYIMGDFNINLLNVDDHLPSAEFLEMMYSYSFLPLINKPTRVKSTSATLIDNIYCNNIDNNDLVLTGIFFTDLSDHFPIFCVSKNKVNEEQPQCIKKRIFNDANKLKFMNMIQDLQWTNVLSCNDCQEAFTNFYTKFVYCYNQSFPLKDWCVNYRTRKSWLSSGMKESIKRKNKLYVKSIKFPSLQNIRVYKIYRNKLNSVLRKAERDHYEILLKGCQNNLSKSWKIIKQVINKSNKSNSLSSKFVINNKSVSDPNIIANAFNKFYVNIGQTRSRNIPCVNRDVCSFIKSSNSNSIFIAPANHEEVIKVIKSLNNSAPGYDGITSNILKCSIDAYIQPLTHIVNLSFSQGIFPEELKTAQVVPLYKTDDPTLINNYRPVSILPTFSKVFERLMYNRLYAFINDNNILYKYQFGFRQKYATSMALITLVDKIMKSLDNNEYVVGLFLDLSKAFDTVVHDILLKKMQKYGIRGIALKWFCNYLSNRKQFVSFNYCESLRLNINCGVPQGSILGPLLFLIYVNDLANVSENLFLTLFADDTSVFYSDKSIDSALMTINEELVKLLEWLHINKLSLNIKKTHYVIFSLRKKVKTSLKICIDNNILERVSKSKFLGVMIDSKMSWNDHIKYIKSKISRAIGLLCRARKVFKKSTLLTLYYSFIYPHIIYCIEVWGSASDCYISSLFKLQKRSVRIIESAHYRANTEPLFRNCSYYHLTKFINILCYLLCTNMLMICYQNCFIRCLVKI